MLDLDQRNIFAGGSDLHEETVWDSFYSIDGYVSCTVVNESCHTNNQKKSITRFAHFEL